MSEFFNFSCFFAVFPFCLRNYANGISNCFDFLVFIAPPAPDSKGGAGKSVVKKTSYCRWYDDFYYSSKLKFHKQALKSWIETKSQRQNASKQSPSITFIVSFTRFISYLNVYESRMAICLPLARRTPSMGNYNFPGCSRQFLFNRTYKMHCNKTRRSSVIFSYLSRLSHSYKLWIAQKFAWAFKAPCIEKHIPENQTANIKKLYVFISHNTRQ